MSTPDVKPNGTKVTINGDEWEIVGTVAGHYRLTRTEGNAVHRTVLDIGQVNALMNAKPSQP